VRKFWKVYRWIYLGAVLFGIYHYAVINPVETTIELSQTKYIIAYILASLFWLIPAIGLFLYSLNRRTIIIFWKLYCVYFIYNVISMTAGFFKTGKFPVLLPFHAIALVGLFLYSFTKNSTDTIPDSK